MFLEKEKDVDEQFNFFKKDHSSMINKQNSNILTVIILVAFVLSLGELFYLANKLDSARNELRAGDMREKVLTSKVSDLRSEQMENEQLKLLSATPLVDNNILPMPPPPISMPMPMYEPISLESELEHRNIPDKKIYAEYLREKSKINSEIALAYNKKELLKIQLENMLLQEKIKDMNKILTVKGK